MIINDDSFILVTGAAGFIGSALVKKLLKNGYKVVGVDNLNDYYEITLKRARLESIDSEIKNSNGEWHFFELGIDDDKSINDLFRKFNPQVVYNLAAQAGVRYSITNPKSYISSNLIGFSNILEMCRNFNVKNFIYASSSSVYGGNKKIPFSEKDNTDHQVSLYAATKKSNEILAHSYSHLYNIPSTGVRFFTVYGPWGRPDMAPMIFTRSILKKEPINVFNFGKMQRDFTYIDDIVETLLRLLDKPATPNKNFDFQNPDPSTSFAPHRIFNIGNSKPIELLNFIEELENILGEKAAFNMLPMQKGDVEITCANTEELKKWIGYNPSTLLKDGIKYFVNWYLEFYGYK